MRNTKLMTLLAAGLVLFACQKERTEDAALVPGKQLTFTATIDGAGTRTSVDDTKISWNPAEEINIFYGASAGSKFVSQNTEPSQSVTFSGTLTAFTGTTEAGEPNSFWAIYPYDESNSSSGSSVTAYLPENQVGVPNNVPDKALMMVAKASGLALSFKQVCARIKVVVSTPGIKKIEIRGNNDETIAGSAVITMNSQGLPEWQDAGTGAGKVIELVPESGTTFEVAEYSIPIYPQTFSAGFTMTCYKTAEQGSYSTGAVTFGRNQVRTVNTNRVTEWTSSAPVPEAVDLGLPSGIKWASFNIGATTPEEYGDYYAWGETEPKERFFSGNYKWGDGSSGTLAKYCNKSNYGFYYGCGRFTDTETVLDLDDDVANANLGGDWRMPTDAEWIELRENCTWTWTTQNGVNGILVTANNGNNIFIPAAGYKAGLNKNYVGSDGYYWSSSLETSNPSNSWAVYFYSDEFDRYYYGRYMGLTVRPVQGEPPISVSGVELSPEALTLQIGGTNKLTATVFPTNASRRTVTWSSSNESVAAVSSLGIVTGVSDGTATITCTTNDGKHTATCAVTVIGSPAIPEAIDLGLPSGLKWSSFNLGASIPEEYGGYYAWGETEPYYTCQYPLTWKEGKDAGYEWASYKWCNGTSSTLTKYCYDAAYGSDGFTDNKIVLGLDDDAAHVNLGGNWRMPTDAEWTELIDNCTLTWTKRNGVNGMMVTASNGNSIFIPASAGRRNETNLQFWGDHGCYWSSSLHLDYTNNAKCVNFTDLTNSSWHRLSRYFGLSVRPVYDDSETVQVESVTLDQSTLELYLGQTATLRATILPANATNQTVVWISADTSISKVDQNGIVTGVAQGSTVVIATNYNGMKQAECTVTVHSGSSAMPIPETIDLGLPSGLKWASFNLGATNPEEYGDYFAWGETEPYYSSQDPLTWKEGKEAGYEWASYKWCNGSSSTLTKYCNDSSYGYNGYTDTKTILDPKDDAAHVNLGGNWRMPTDAEWTELMDNCICTWTTLNGVNGALYTADNGNSLFIPAAGSRNATNALNAGNRGLYWSSSLWPSNTSYAWSAGFYSSAVRSDGLYRWVGLTIRPVYAE